jgi:hypothetical protein
MPSVQHEGVLELVRRQPVFAAQLLQQLLDIGVPPFTEARIVDTALNQISPVEFRADAVVLLESGAPMLGVIVEAQLQRDDEKSYSWPAYAVMARVRHRCPCVVIVVTFDKKTARWASSQIDLGGGNTYRPLVIGPDQMPLITDPTEASNHLPLAMLSILAHGQGDPEAAVAAGKAALHAISQLPEGQQEVYLLMIDAALSETARKTMATQPGFEKLLSEAQRRDRERTRAEGKAEGKIDEAAKMLLKLLSVRGLAITDEHRRRILNCEDLAVLEGWYDRVLSVSSVDDLLG